MKNKILLLLLLLITTVAFCKPTVQAYVDNNKPAVGEAFNLNIEIKGDDASQYFFDMPNINNFELESAGQMTSSSSTYVNGKFSTTITKTYKYTVFPLKQGSFILPQFLVTNNKHKIYTKPIKIVVSKQGSGNSKKSYNNQGFGNSQSYAYNKDFSENIFVKAEIDDASSFLVNKPFTVNYYFYTAYETDIAWGNEPEFNGFITKDVFRATNQKFNIATYNGKRYNKMLLRTYNLTPTKTGKLIIPSLSIKATIYNRRSFFSYSGNSKKIMVASKERKINVSDIPKKNMPKTFAGAVGNFNILSKCSTNNLKAGDSFTYTIIIKGKGNFEQLANPIIPNNPHFRFTAPEVNTTNKSKSFKYLVISLDEGEFNLGKTVFSYYNPKSKKFVTLKTKDYKLKVNHSDKTYAVTSQGAVVLKNTDIYFDETSTKLNKVTYLVNQTWYWVLFVVIFLGIFVSIMLYSFNNKINSDYSYQRQKNAQKIIKKYLSIAADFAQKGDANFYSAAQNGLISYVCDLYNLNKSEESTKIISELSKISQPTSDSLKVYLNKCDEARFMPGGLSSQSIKHDFNQLKQLISDLNKGRKVK